MEGWKMMKTSGLDIWLSDNAFSVFKIVVQDLIPNIKKQSTTTTYILHFEILSSFFSSTTHWKELHVFII